MKSLQTFGPLPTAPFFYQPTRAGLQGGFGRLGAGQGPPVGVGAGKGAEIGAAQGASIGSSIVPVIGTAIGAVIGAIGGAIAGSIGKQDPEIQNFDQAIALWQVNPDAVYNLANKYLVLAGFFDLTNNQAGKIRIYRRYGRMGEEAFTRDFATQIYNAAQSGVIQPSDTASTVYQKVILPWENSWGFGAEPSNPHSEFMDRLLTGLIWDYVTGYGPRNWFSRSGPLPASFSSIPPFAFPAAAQASTVTTGQVNPVGSVTSPPPQGAISTTATAGPTPAQQVASPPAVGTPISYAPDVSQNNMPIALPGGLTFAGLDANNKSWIIANPGSGSLYVLWQGSLLPYRSGMFAPSSSSSVNPVGSTATVTTGTPTPTPAQQVATAPPVGTGVGYAPDMAQNGVAVALPTGLTFAGTDPNNGSWILKNTSSGVLYVLWQGSLVPYTSGMFAAASGNPNQTVATTTSGQPVTQGQIQQLINQFAAQGQSAQQAYTSALQTLQAHGVDSTPAVQSAVQSAATQTPAPSGPSSGLVLGIAAAVAAGLMLAH